MSSNDELSRRNLALEKEVRRLSAELIQCQADKEFEGSLWKPLQVANSDWTQAISLVVEREKHKAEMESRKVFEILQCKDNKIEELKQNVNVQQLEISSLVQQRTVNEEDGGLMKKELTALQEQLGDKDHELQEMMAECRRKGEEERQVVQALEKEKEGLTSRCATLQSDLEEKGRQADSQRNQANAAAAAAQARVKELEDELHKTLKEQSGPHSSSSSLALQLSSNEEEVTQKDEQLSQLRDSGEGPSDNLDSAGLGTAPRRQMKTQRSSSFELQHRVESLERHVEKTMAQLNFLAEKLGISEQLAQKLTSDLAGVEQQKKVLEMELEQWRKMQTAPPAPPPAAPVNTGCSCQGRTMVPSTAHPVAPALEAEVKQLLAKLKGASAEVARQVAANKALQGQLQEKEDKLRQLQDKLVSHSSSPPSVIDYFSCLFFDNDLQDGAPAPRY